MPEIAEIARTVHYARKNLLGKTIASCTAPEDAKVFDVKYNTTGAQFQKHMTNNTVKDIGQQGKYFWFIMSKPPHPVFHFGMGGWLNFKNEHTYYYRPKEGEKAPEEWPPKYWKFHLETKAEKGQEKIEAAFVDFRRFARIKLVDCPGDQIRQHSPLLENGPDPVIDKDQVTVEWLKEKCKSKKVPIKAMLLDQANISGIGNWVGDEIMYNAKMHPEQYANTLSDAQIHQLHKSIHYICGTACELLADSEKFPEDWLFKHRWGKGKKDASKTLPNGEKIVFLTVGGRTSAVIPSVQKKTGPVAKDVDEADLEDESDAKPVEKAKTNASKAEPKSAAAAPKAKGKAQGRNSKVKSEPEDAVDEEPQPKPVANGRKRKAKTEEQDTQEKASNTKGAKAKKAKVAAKEAPVSNGTTATRRSTRNSRG
jgi:formamidopyrimidine-DNA glycosylase